MDKDTINSGYFNNIAKIRIFELKGKAKGETKERPRRDQGETKDRPRRDQEETKERPRRDNDKMIE